MPGVEFTKVTDTTTPQRDGTYKREKLYVFYIDHHGPFTERVSAEPFDPGEIERRVQSLRTHLATLPR